MNPFKFIRTLAIVFKHSWGMARAIERHEKRKQQSEYVPTFPCPKCPGVANSEKALADHMAARHGIDTTGARHDG